ncbi:MAG TPA: sigma-70 family RNA polymerase sigma factor [Myxococcales bacterium]|nr:sigma-70 family RNA polymerase sigma factor [Myxococcales bacterium]
MDDRELVDALRAGDESAFLALVRAHHGSMLRVASMFVPSAAVAEEVVQETWLAVLKGLDGFEGRAPLKSWIFRVLANRARSRAQKEGRSSPFSEFEADDEPAVDGARFLPDDHDRWPGHWSAPPPQWAEERLLTQEMLQIAGVAIDALPPQQRQVIVLRDVEGQSSDDVCEALGVSEGNQRVLLHRARSKVRAVLERHFEEPRR